MTLPQPRRRLTDMSIWWHPSGAMSGIYRASWRQRRSHRLDDRGPEALDHLYRMREAVPGDGNLQPRHTQRGELLSTAQIGVGVEVVISSASAVDVGKRDVGVRPAPTGGVESPTQVVDSLGETL